MKYTEKFHLPQWEEDDRILRTDFNQMCGCIEAGLANGYSTSRRVPSDVFDLVIRAEQLKTVVYTFPQGAPKAVFVSGHYALVLIPQGNTVRVGPFNVTTNWKNTVVLKLAGDQLYVTEVGDSFSVETFHVAALF